MFLTSSPTNPAFNPVLVHEPVMLRAATPADFAEWAALRETSREHLTRWEEAWSPDQATAASFRRRLRTYDADRRRGGGLFLLAFRREDRRMVGGVTLSNIRYGVSRSGILGYWIGAPYVRRGYGSAAVQALVAHAMEAIALNRLVAGCQPENIASQKLLESCGFSEEGLARDYLRINGEWRDHKIFALTAADYDRLKVKLS